MKRFSLVFIAFFIYQTIGFAQNNCLFRNPLCFYNTDILSYLQVLHKNQDDEKMSRFFYGPLATQKNNASFIKKLTLSDFGYSLKRVGVKEIAKNKWSLTYQRTIMGTHENFKIECAVINDTCRIYIDLKQWEVIFK
jgi:hypothetical protein